MGLFVSYWTLVRHIALVGLLLELGAMKFEVGVKNHIVMDTASYEVRHVDRKANGQHGDLHFVAVQTVFTAESRFALAKTPRVHQHAGRRHQ